MADENVVKYIKDNLKKGSSKEEIRKALLKARHKKEIVDEAFKCLEPKKASESKTTIIIGAVVLIAVVLLLVTMFSLPPPSGPPILPEEESIGDMYLKDVREMSNEDKDSFNLEIEERFKTECREGTQDCPPKVLLKYSFLKLDIGRSIGPEDRTYMEQQLRAYDGEYTKIYEARVSADNPILTKSDEDLLFLMYLLRVSQSGMDDRLDYWFDLINRFEFGDDDIKYQFIILFNRKLFSGFETKGEIIREFCYPRSLPIISNGIVLNGTMMTSELLDDIYTSGHRLGCV